MIQAESKSPASNLSIELLRLIFAYFCPSTLPRPPRMAAMCRAWRVADGLPARCPRSRHQCFQSLGTEGTWLFRNSKLAQSYLQGIPRGRARPPRLHPSVYIRIITCEVLTMLIALLPNLCHLRVEENSLKTLWRIDISTATVNSLRLTARSLKTLEIDRPLSSLRTLAPNLETLVTRCPLSSGLNCQVLRRFGSWVREQPTG
jgi:hypothetical protein